MMPVLDEWDEEAGDWKPDEWDRKVHAVLAWRDRVADSVDGPVPVFGTSAWAAADERTQVVSYARHERDVAAARGKSISNRMATEAAARVADRDAQREMAAEWTRRGYSRAPLSPETSAQRLADRERRASTPRPWEDGYAESLGSPEIPSPRRPDDAKESVQRASTAAACATARQDANAAVAPGSREEELPWRVTDTPQAGLRNADVRF